MPDSVLSEDDPRTGAHPVLGRRFTARIVVVAVALGLLASGANRSNAQDARPIAPTDLVAVTDHISAPSIAGCTDVTIADSSDGSVVSRAGTQWYDTPSVGQVTATSDGRLFAWLSNNNYWFVHIMIWQPGNRRWQLRTFYEGPHRHPTGGAIAISPDDETLLVADDNTLRKYQIANVSPGSLGPVVQLTIDPELARSGWMDATVPAAIEFTADSQTAYVVVNNGFVYTLDIDAMSWRGSPIPYPVIASEKSYGARRTFASLSPDEEWLVINAGDRARGGGVSLVDLQGLQTEQLDAPELTETWGVDFNSVGADRGLLAVHGRSRLGVYRLVDRHLELVASMGITPPGVRNWPVHSRFQARFASLSWSGDGTRLIANQGGAKEWRIVELSAESPRRLESVAIFESCGYNEQGSQGFDVVTLQKRPTLTAMPPPSATPTTTRTPTASTTPTSTSTPLPATPTPSLTPTNLPTPTHTTEPSSLFLPIALREQCDPEYYRSDIVLVIDTSSSMTGQKIENARDAAISFVNLIDLAPGRSQVAVVRYDREAEVVRELTRAKASIDAAIRSLHVRSGTHIDKGLRAALAELQSDRHVERNSQVLILLTDGVQTGTPGEELRAAAEVHAAGVRAYTIGLGADVNEATLREIAGVGERYHFAPDSADLARIYGEIARDLMCPGVELWGGR